MEIFEFLFAIITVLATALVLLFFIAGKYGLLEEKKKAKKENKK